MISALDFPLARIFLFSSNKVASPLHCPSDSPDPDTPIGGFEDSRIVAFSSKG
uniref:Uncharacterized protein n=1 Tax=Utricularia reniformis TaxID=192314 RepID=A0A1Y0B0U5_9LAMI|nr:hypothetical protein AEK19_MT0755 [Utricularia reniformis]ART30998.1 hypothetical protein AEK19_MT0755 [Utricularia reniformis]